MAPDDDNNTASCSSVPTSDDGVAVPDYISPVPGDDARVPVEDTPAPGDDAPAPGDDTPAPVVTLRLLSMTCPFRKGYSGAAVVCLGFAHVGAPSRQQ